MPSLLEKAYVNQKIPFNNFALYEMNKVYQKAWGMDEEGVPVEKMQMGFVVAERKNSETTAYYKAKYYVEKLLEEFNIVPRFSALKIKLPIGLPFENKRAAEIWVDEVCVGIVGEFKNSVRRNFKLADYLAGFEIDLDAILKLRKAKVVQGDFGVREKIDETVTSEKNYAEVLAEIAKKYPEAEITPVGIYQPEGSNSKNMTFHIEK